MGRGSVFLSIAAWLKPSMTGKIIRQSARSFLNSSMQSKAVYCEAFTSSGGLLQAELLLSLTHTWLNKTSQWTFALNGVLQGWKKWPMLDFIKSLEKGFGVMWRLKESRHSELTVREGRSWKGKQPLLNEPLKGCPLYLGFLIFIVNPSQALSAAKSAIIHSPKSESWKKASA